MVSGVYSTTSPRATLVLTDLNLGAQPVEFARPLIQELQ